MRPKPPCFTVRRRGQRGPAKRYTVTEVVTAKLENKSNVLRYQLQFAGVSLDRILGGFLCQGTNTIELFPDVVAEAQEIVCGISKRSAEPLVCSRRLQQTENPNLASILQQL